MHKRFIKRIGIDYPIIQAPMANLSTPKLAATITNAGGLGSLPLGATDISSSKAVKTIIDEFQSQTSNESFKRKVNLNFFCHDEKVGGPDYTLQQHDSWKRLYSNVDNSSSVIDGLNKTPIFSKKTISFKRLEVEPALKSNYSQLMNLITSSDYKPSVISFHFGSPNSSTIKLLKSNGIVVLVTVTSLQEASVISKLGVDGFIAQGYEAGGHRGNFLLDQHNDENLSTTVLTELLVNKFGEEFFIIPAGGIMTGQSISNYLRLGASAVQLGTAFITTPEANKNAFIKAYLQDTPVTLNKYNTVMTSLVSGKPARCLRTPFISNLISSFENDEIIKSLDDLPPYGFLVQGHRKFKSLKGDTLDYGFHLAGQNYHQININSSASEIFTKLIDESGLKSLPVTNEARL